MSEVRTRATPWHARAPRWMWVALIASLAVNCLVLGIVFRSVWHIGQVQALSGDRGPAGFSSFLASLPPERSSELRRIYEADRPELRSLRGKLRDLRGEIIETLRADPLDAERLKVAQSRLLDTEIEMRRIIHRSLAQVAARMTAEERNAYLDWREARRRERRSFGSGERGFGEAREPARQP
ncbi:MAG TPA: periplasmic heavy metal sensor [Hyphomicrobiaceae bacterium]|nr:periplasmic heavy metal sensor [Hyphomicrobiaceae bacterium]